MIVLSGRSSKKPVESALSPTGAPVLNSPLGSNPDKQRIVSVTEERIETVETKPGKKKVRQHIDNISAPEYFTKGTLLLPSCCN